MPAHELYNQSTRHEPAPMKWVQEVGAAESLADFIKRFESLPAGEKIVIPFEFIKTLPPDFTSSQTHTLPEVYLNSHNELCVSDGNHRVNDAVWHITNSGLSLQGRGILCRKVCPPTV